ncbi:MAG: trehalose-phosphatase [Microbacterium sp.]
MTLERRAETRRLLVALDFDGTLSPLVDEPMTARALPESKAAVARLVALPDTIVAFVSGRSLADLRVIAEHDDASPIWLAGSHGAEQWRPAGAPAAPVTSDPAQDALVAELTADAQHLVDGIEGAWIEPKRFGFGLHTRTAGETETAKAQAAIDALVAERASGWRRRTGRDLIEFAWRHEGKDSVIAELRQATGATGVLFAGDDVTDEDALRSLGEDDLGVKVGDGETAASVRVHDIPALAALLDRLADLRGAGGREAE